MKKEKEKKEKKNLSLTARIAIAFLAVTVVPVIMIAVILQQPLSSRLRNLGRTYGVEDLSYSNMYNNSTIMARILDGYLEELHADLDSDPSLIEDPGFLQGFRNGSQADIRASLVVIRDGSVIFNGSDMDDAGVSGMLASYEANNADMEEDWYHIHSGIQSMVKGTDVLFADGSSGRAYIIADMNQIVPNMRRWLMDLMVVCIMVLLITALIMGTWLYASTVNPLNQLKKAARNIRDGNLDFHVESKGITEIAEVCEDFEEMRKRLKENEEEKLVVDSGNKELISNISHDLKTPLTAIRGYCEGIMDGVADTPEKMNKYVRTIYSKANEMDTLINELTFYSRIDTNRIPYTFTRLNVTEFFDDCMDELQLDAENRGIELTYQNELRDKNVQIIGDAEQLKRVVRNITGNSIKYMDKPEKHIDVKLMDKDDFIQADFSDNGKGIAAGDLPLIFDRFYRTDASRNSARGGSGIGLSIVKKILEDHGGKVWATSREGEGTTIHFIIRKYHEVISNE